MRIALGAGRPLQDAQAFLAEFQQMRTMMSRMSKGATPDQMGQMDPAMAAAAPAEAGNRAQRRYAKKKNKKGGGKGGGGFGKK
jgi:signal recognition particle GTPase